MSKDEAKRMQALYDEAPYPSALSEGRPPGVPLLEHWINGIYGFMQAVLYNRCRILVAGCGSGEEAISLAQYYPESDVVGVDFSAKSIEIAAQKVNELGIRNLNFFVADLTDRSLANRFAPFDFILCHGVADYVVSVDAMLSNFSLLLNENGLIHLSVNSPYHPAGRIREAMSSLNVEHNSYNDSKEQRSKLKVISKLIGEKSGVRNIGEAPHSYLSVDIFPPIAHHFSLDEWIDKGHEHQLYFCASMEALLGLVQLTDSELPVLFGFEKDDLSKWITRLSQAAGMQLLFGKKRSVKINFDREEEVLNWKPILSRSVGELPKMTMTAEYPMHLSLQFAGLPVFTIYSNAFDLEVLRLCDGRKTIDQIVQGIDVEGDFDHLKTSLFRAYHYGIISS